MYVLVCVCNVYVCMLQYVCIRTYACMYTLMHAGVYDTTLCVLVCRYTIIHVFR